MDREQQQQQTTSSNNKQAHMYMYMYININKQKCELSLFDLFVHIGLAPGIASLSFNSIAAHFYSVHEPHNSTICIGATCYATSYYIGAGAGLLAAFISIGLIPKTQPGNKQIK
jgi:hypothetical protein